eukprot:Opistho-2@7067
MADVDFQDDYDQEMDEIEEDTTRLKSAVTKRKGRGFADRTSEARDAETYDTLMDDESSGPGPQRSVEGWIVFVTGVNEEALEDQLHEKFGEYGAIKNLSLPPDRRTGFIKGYALVEYETKKEGQAAIDNLDGSDLLGQAISVSWAFVRGPDSAGNAHGGRSRGGRRNNNNRRR